MTTSFSFQIYANRKYKVLGKRTHDARIVALMQAVSINHILTLNPTDFTNLTEIVVVRPQDIVGES